MPVYIFYSIMKGLALITSKRLSYPNKERTIRQVYNTNMRLRHITGSKEMVADHPSVITDATAHKGQWHQLFKNDAPLQIEIGMGKGQFITQMALENPHINYIGIEKYPTVMLKALSKRDPEINNLYYICQNAENLADIFAPEEVQTIYLNFSDPWPKDRHAKRRLTSRAFFVRYDQVLSASGKIEFKTDNRALFDFSLTEVTAAGWQLNAFTYDLHHDEKLNRGNIMTEYETKFSALGNPIHKLIASR